MTFGPRVGDCEELNRFSPQLGIQFSRPVSQVYLSFYGYAGNYIATDNLGNTVTVTATIGGVTNTYYLRSGFAFSNTAGPGPKTTIDVLVDRAVDGNPFKPFGTWSATF